VLFPFVSQKAIGLLGAAGLKFRVAGLLFPRPRWPVAGAGATHSVAGWGEGGIANGDTPENGAGTPAPQQHSLRRNCRRLHSEKKMLHADKFNPAAGQDPPYSQETFSQTAYDVHQWSTVSPQKKRIKNNNV